ncbi:MAG: ornithine cyclodeaminase family protein [Acidobacteriota bacterium]
MPILLNEAVVRQCLSMPALIDAMSGALAEFSAGRVTQPIRSVLEVGAEKNYFGVMPASIDGRQAVGTKLVTVYPSNHAKGLTSHLATILLLDHATGGLMALLDGRYITEARTAAVSAVSVQQLARPDATSLAILGSGVQAHSHLEAIRHVRNITDVRVWSPTAAHRERFAREASAATGLPVRACATPGDAVRGAGVIVLATASKTPIVDDADIAEGAHICAVGACRPDQREMPTALVQRARLFVDSRAAALKEAGEVLLPIGEGAITSAHIVGELGDVINGTVAGRLDNAQVTIFKSLGMAVEDVVAAQLAVIRAKELGLGQEIEL